MARIKNTKKRKKGTNPKTLKTTNIPSCLKMSETVTQDNINSTEFLQEQFDNDNINEICDDDEETDAPFGRMVNDEERSETFVTMKSIFNQVYHLV